MMGNFGSCPCGTVASISVTAARQNYFEIRKAVPKSADIMCIVKADAYGHGAEFLAPLYEKLGAGAFGVATINEAIQLRRCGIVLPILILGYTPVCYARELAEYGITQCVFSLSYAKALSAAATSLGKEINIHIKIDTGMSRLGFEAKTDSDIEQIYRAVTSRGLSATGIFTHLSSADIDEREFTLAQFDNFIWASEKLSQMLGKCLIRHAANSAAIIDYPEFALDMVRAGIILYGMAPSDRLMNRLPLSAVMTLSSEVSLVKNVDAGRSVGYSRKFIANKPTRVATVSIGYADGFFRYGSCGGATLTVRGREAKTVGNVCMDQLMLDVTHIDGVEMGDKVTVFGSGGRSAEALAKEIGTICYELTSAVGVRVPRVYIDDGRIIEIKNRILGGL